MQSYKTIILAAALLILTFLAAGCISSDSSSQTTYPQANVPEEVIDKQPATTEYVTPVENVQVVAEPVVDNWWDGKDGYTPVTISADDNLFGVELEGVKYEGGNSFSYSLYDEKQNMILLHQELTASTLHLERELQPAQYKELVAEYGTPVHVTMETIDDDPTHAGMDHVAVKYVGSKGEFEYERDIITNRNGKILDLGVTAYISRYLNL